MIPEQSAPKKHFLSLYLGTVGALFLAFFTLWQTASFLPHSKMIRDLFLEENSLLETLALGFLFTALVITVVNLLGTQKTRMYSSYWWLFPFGIFLLICDETSFGRVYYDWYSPLNICGAKFDALHDALVILPHCLPHFGVSKIVFTLSAVLFLAAAVTICSSWALKHKEVLITSLKENPVWLYLVFAFILFCLGGGLEFLVEIDSLKIEKNGFLVFLEEALESLAEYTVLFAAFVFSQKKSTS